MTTASTIRRQYLELKTRYPNTILFFRLGDFYETFDDDAKLVAAELNITLTSRPMGKDLRVPLAGVPYHGIDAAVAKLVGRSYRVAVCEQVAEPPEVISAAPAPPHEATDPKSEPTVKRGTLWDGPAETYRTEGELNGWKATQGKLFDLPPASKPAPQNQGVLL